MTDTRPGVRLLRRSNQANLVEFSLRILPRCEYAKFAQAAVLAGLLVSLPTDTAAR
jgi:hypothetical protein